jgi:EmrB/QacA subfamily drug resistance transporter
VERNRPIKARLPAGTPDAGTRSAGSGADAKWLVLSAVMLGSFMGPIDGSIVNTVLPDIATYFGTDISIVQWVPTIYLLTISCLILLYGRLGDMVGYRRVYLWGLGAFTVASILCGSAQSIWMLIAFRAAQGLAAGMMMAVGFAIVTSVFPADQRGQAMGIYAISIAAALGLGPTLGGVIAEYLSWRYVFYVNVPIGIAALAWAARIIPRGGTVAGQRLDWPGAVTAFIFLAALLLFANRGQNWGWTSPAVLALAGTAAGFGAVFVRIEQATAQPMLDLSLFRSRRFSFAATSALLNFMALFAVIFLTPFYLAIALRYSILKVGLVIAASPCATLAIAPLSGTLSDRVGTRGLTSLGMAITAAGLCLLSGLDATAGAGTVIGHLVIVGIGAGVFQSPNNSAVMGSVPASRLGIASGMLAAVRNVGMVLGIAVAGAVLYNTAPSSAALSPDRYAPVDVAEFLGGLRRAYLTGAVLAAAGAVTSLLAVERAPFAGGARGRSLD